MMSRACQRMIVKHMAVIFVGAAVFFFASLFCLYSCEVNDCSQSVCVKSSIINQKQEIFSSLFGWNSKQKLFTYLTVLILTGPNNLERRNTIRNTWLKTKTEDVLHFFVIGSKGLPPDLIAVLNLEQLQHHDLVLLSNINDSYQGLTQKLLQSFIWLHQNVQTLFVFKADDDTFARLNIIVNELQESKPKNLLYWGFFDGRARIKKQGPWAEKDWFLCDYYLPHALGGGYILSVDLVEFIATNSKHLKIYKSEDITMGTWLAPLDITRFHDPRFDTEYRSRGCSNSYLVTHKQSIEQMKEKHSELENHDRLCDKEVKLRLSYLYNWNVMPSHCCIRNDSTIP